MKKLLIFGLSLAMSSMAFAFDETREINQSSFTATNDTCKWINKTSGNGFSAQVSSTGANSDFRGIIVASVTTGGIIGIYDSTFSCLPNTMISSVTLNSANEFHYNVRLYNGLSYTTTGNSGGVTILYKVN